LETWEPSQLSLVDTRKPRETCVEVAGRRTFRIYRDCKLAGRSKVPVSTQVTSVLFFRTVQTGSRVHPVPNLIGSVGSFLEARQPEREVEHSHSYSGLVKSEVSVAVILLQLWTKGNFTFTYVRRDFAVVQHPLCARFVLPTYLITYLITYLLKCLLTYILTPRSRVLLEKLTGLQLVKKFPAFYGTRKFITAFTNARHLSVF
jgi:hypothetical protein